MCVGGGDNTAVGAGEGPSDVSGASNVDCNLESGER